MTELKFCAKCGEKSLHWDGEKKWNCTNCDYVLFHNVAGAVAVIIRYQDEILLTRRNQDPQKGKLDLPGGFIDPNETAEEAACREIREELGIEISNSDLKYITTSPNNYLYKNVPYRTMDIFYECPLKSDVITINAEDEIQELIWVKRSEIDLNQIGFVSIRKVIGEKYLG